MATYFDDTLTGTLNTLLDAHTADSGGGWTKVVSAASTWDNRLSGDGFVFKGGSSSANGYLYKRTTAMPVADYQVDHTFKVKSILASDSVGAYARIVDFNNNYRVILTQDGSIFLRRIVAGAQTTLATGTVTLVVGETHTISLRVVGSLLTMLFDGAVVAPTSGSNPVTDTSFASAGSGGIAIGFASSTAQSASTGMQGDRVTITDPPLVKTVAPVVSGTRVVGETLSSTTGTFTGAPTSYTYQWLRDGSPIVGATSSTYVLDGADAAHTLRCAVTAHDSVTSTDSLPADSNGLAVVAEIVGTDVQFWTAAGFGLGGAPGIQIPNPAAVWDNVTHAETVAGDVEYRVVYVKNVHSVRSATVTVGWVSAQTTSPTTDIAIGVAVEPAGSDVTAIANESTPPVGVTFSAPSTEGAGASLGTLAPGQARGLWMRWTVIAGTADLPADTCTLAYSATPV